MVPDLGNPSFVVPGTQKGGFDFLKVIIKYFYIRIIKPTKPIDKV